MKRISRRTTRRLRGELSRIALHIGVHHSPAGTFIYIWPDNTITIHPPAAAPYTDTPFLGEKRGMGLTKPDIDAQERRDFRRAHRDRMISSPSTGAFQQLIVNRVSNDPRSVELARLFGLL